jgi:hypothetical protein
VVVDFFDVMVELVVGKMPVVVVVDVIVVVVVEKYVM